MTAADSFNSVMHLENTLRSTDCSSVQSVFICAGQWWGSVGNTIIHTATRVHWSTANKYESQTDDSVVSWRRTGLQRKKSKALVPLYLIPLYLSMHIQPCQCVYSVTAEALCHCSAVGFTSQTQTAKVTFEFPGITTMLYLTGLIMFPPVCALQTRMDRPFGAFLFWSNKKGAGM